MAIVEYLNATANHLQRPDGDKVREQDMRTRYNLPRVSGLMRPFPDQTSASYLSGLSLSDVNAEGIRQQIISNCKR